MSAFAVDSWPRRPCHPRSTSPPAWRPCVCGCWPSFMITGDWVREGEAAVAVTKQEHHAVVVVVGERQVRRAVAVEIAQDHFRGTVGHCDRAAGRHAKTPIASAEQYGDARPLATNRSGLPSRSTSPRATFPGAPAMAMGESGAGSNRGRWACVGVQALARSAASTVAENGPDHRSRCADIGVARAERYPAERRSSAVRPGEGINSMTLTRRSKADVHDSRPRPRQVRVYASDPRPVTRYPRPKRTQLTGISMGTEYTL